MIESCELQGHNIITTLTHSTGEDGYHIIGVSPPAASSQQPGAQHKLLLYLDYLELSTNIQEPEKAPTKAYSFLEVPTSAFTIKNL